MLSFSNNERPQQQQQRSNLGNIQENEILRPSRRGRGHSRRSITWANISNIRNSFVLRPKPSGPSNTSSSSNNRNSRHWQHLRNFRNSIVTRTSRFRNNGGSDRGVGGARNNWRNFRDSFVIRVNRPEAGDDDGDSGPGCDLCGICRCCTCFTLGKHNKNYDGFIYKNSLSLLSNRFCKDSYWNTQDGGTNILFCHSEYFVKLWTRVSNSSRKHLYFYIK